MEVYIVLPHATIETRNLFEKATQLAASVLAPSTKSNYKRAWDRFVTYAKEMGFNLMEVSSAEFPG